MRFICEPGDSPSVGIYFMVQCGRPLLMVWVCDRAMTPPPCCAAGEGIPRREQRGVYPHPAALPASGLREVPHSLQWVETAPSLLIDNQAYSIGLSVRRCVCVCVARLRAVQDREYGGLPGEAPVGPGQAELPQLLVLGPPGDPPGLQGDAVHQRPQVRRPEPRAAIAPKAKRVFCSCY